MTPAAIILLAANLVPVAGILFWGWDAFVLLMLYWMETAIIGFWTIVRLVALDPARRSGIGFEGANKPAGRVALAAFFTVHAGIFMTVHFVFLWALFSGGWAERIHGVRAFFQEMVVGTGLWIPLLVLFVARGFQVLRPVLWRRLRIVDDAGDPDSGEGVLSGLYVRIVVMQVTIIVGGWLTLLSGTNLTLILLIALKTLFEVFFDPIAFLSKNLPGKAAASGSGSA